MPQRFVTKPTKTKTIRMDDEILTWAKRAAKKANVSVNGFFSQILRDAFDKRHSKA